MLHRRRFIVSFEEKKKKAFGAGRETANTYLRVTFLLLNELRLCSEEINHSECQHMAMQRSDGTHLREHRGFA